MHIDLNGKVAIVTGGARGIGQCIAMALASEGVKTVVIDINEADLQESKQKFDELGYRGLHLCCDIRDAAQIDEVVKQAVDEYGRIDILVNNAGVARGKPVDELTDEVWQQNIDINLTGTFRMCRAVIPQMKLQQAGRIINAASFAAVIPSYGGAAYASSKAGVHYLTRTLAGELGPWNITVNSYAPGMIPTDMNHFADRTPEEQAQMLDMLSLRRWGKKEDIANLIVFLSSDQADYITGALIEISGGKYAIQRPGVAYQHYVAQTTGSE
ncbi:SDR family NAD(P)-dependent oxidoreductase [Alicyclobacillus fodiniaquatilis]|jgi:3-oxoacyl-[acyl-carrier protein] reductase|uniref:SDR family NAD(P)-dependent oxidoreductase n=1 Tax=Alicyclobacillus fodiniaquatilis TaxID=1661150 RepID=A0ABW4JH95_9BACL